MIFQRPGFGALAQGLLLVSLATVLSMGHPLRAFAARTGTIDADEIEVRESPNLFSKVLEKVKKGTPIAASNLPVEGFHKIRIPSGIMGWVPLNALLLDPPPTPKDLAQAGAPTKEQDSTIGSIPVKPLEEKIHATRKDYRLRFFGGMDFFAATKVINNVASLAGGYHYGGEFVMMFTQSFGAVVRAESILSSTILTDQTSGNIYSVNLGSLPILIGPEYALLGQAFSAHFAALVGMSFPTGITSTISSGTNVGSSASFAANSFTALARANFNWQLTRLFSIFMEGGYRLLLSPVFIPVNTPGTAAGIFQSTFSLNLSGAMVSFGVGLGF